MNLKNFPKRLDSKTSCLRITVPENLDLALEGLIRKVLREQPKTDDIYSFAAEYFETLLKIRDKAGPKFTAAQLCPFHNDEDAHEMIKLAGTFAKPGSAKSTKRNDDSKTKGKPGKTRKTDGNVKNKKPVQQKQATPDLIRKLPTTTTRTATVSSLTPSETDKTKEEQEMPENEEEFVTSDPIKELVEKELMMEASSGKNKTDGNEKTEVDLQNTQEKDKPTETAQNDVKEDKDNSKTEKEEETETHDKTEETENEKTPTEPIKVHENDTQTTETIKETTDNLKTENEESVKEVKEEQDEDVIKASDEITEEANKESGKNVEEIQKSTEDAKETDKLPEKVGELTETVDGRREDKKDEGNKNPSHRDVNRTMETFPVTETIKKITDVLPSEKLPEISEDATEKDKEVSQTENLSSAEQQQTKSRETPAQIISTEVIPEETETKEDEQPAEEEEKEAKPAQQPTVEQVEEVKKVETPAQNASTEIKPEETEVKQPQQPTEEAQESRNVEELEANKVETPEQTVSTEVKPEETEEEQSEQPTEAQESREAEVQETKKAETPEQTVSTEVKTEETEVQPQQQLTGAQEELKKLKSPAQIASTEVKQPIEAQEEEIKVETLAQTESTELKPEETEVQHPQQLTETEEKAIPFQPKPVETDTTDAKESQQPPETSEEVKNVETSAETSLTQTKPQETDTKEGQQPKEASEQPQNIQTPQETKPEDTGTENGQQPTDNNTQPDTKPEEDNSPSIPETKTAETLLAESTPTEKHDTDTPDKENQNTEDAKPVTDTLHPKPENAQKETENTEKDALLQTQNGKNNSENASQPNETTTAEEPKPEESVTVNDEKTFGEIIINNEEERTVEETKSEEAEKPDEKTTKGETAKEEDLIHAEEQKTDENTTEPKTDISEESPTEKPNDSNQPEEDKPAPKTEKDEKQEDDKPETKEPETDKQSETPDTTTEHKMADENETQTTEDDQTKEEPKPTSETSLTPPEENNNQEQPEDELCSVVDIEHIPKEDNKVTTEKPETESDKPTADSIQTAEVETEPKEQPEVEFTQTKESETEPDELCTVVDIQHIPKHEKTDEDNLEVADTQNKTEEEELCTVVDIQNLPKEETDDTKIKTAEANTPKDDKPPVKEDRESEKPNEGGPEPEPDNEGKKTEATDIPIVDPRHVIHVEEVEKPTKPDEIQIKTIQTHYYDTLQVPETVTKEYRVHNVAPATELLVHQLVDENMNTPTGDFLENLVISPPPEDTPTAETTGEQTEHLNPDLPPLAINQPDVEAETPKTESDDLLDLMTPTSGYSLNLSEISLMTVSELFLDSEKRYSSLEKEETRYTVTPKTGDAATDARPEVVEVVEKTILPSRTEAVPVPPRETEEINEEENTQLAETLKEKKEEDAEGEKKETEDPKKEETPQNDSSDGSSNGKSVDSDIPFISVEVKTVIETQVLEDDDDDDDEDDRNGEVEVNVLATIDVRDLTGDEVATLEPDVVAAETEMADGECQSLEECQRKSEDEEKKESGSTGVEGSSFESDLTASSAATEIKRTDSAQRNSASVRSLVSTQSLDFGKRHPLVRTRSLSTFRHGVTDFEVWSTIEKELEDAAIKIQSKFRGYKTRKKLQRENAVQITTEESSVSTTPVEAEVKDEGQHSTGEFHDSIILSEHPR